jgi:hypothetical protein
MTNCEFNLQIAGCGPWVGFTSTTYYTAYLKDKQVIFAKIWQQILPINGKTWYNSRDSGETPVSRHWGQAFGFAHQRAGGGLLMSTVRGASSRNRLVAAAGIVVVLVTVVFTAVLLPDRTLAQAGEPDQAEPGPVRMSPVPPPPPAIQLNPPAATPEPGAVQASAGPPVGGSDLEVVQFRAQASLRRGESAPVAAAEKSASEV